MSCRKKIQRRDFCLIGGVDSYLEPETLEWLVCDRFIRRGQNNAWDHSRRGRGLCLLSASKAAEQCKLDHRAKIRSAVLTHEKNLIKTDTVCLGHGLTAAFEQSSKALAAPQEKIDEIICDMNGEPYRAEEFGFATIRTNDFFVNSAEFQAPADCWGDVGAASGPLFVNLTVVAHQKGYDNGPLTLVWTSSESGERSAAAFTGTRTRSRP